MTKTFSDKEDPDKTYAEKQSEKDEGSYGSIETYTGRMFQPLSPTANSISVIDIAHALSMNCRYNGHCKSFYSVAEHCVLMSRSNFIDDIDVVDENTKQTYRKWALLHDATETYLPDMPRPIKSLVNGFDESEEQLHQAIAEKFGLPYPIPSVVHKMDNMILKDEASELMHSGGDNKFWVFTEEGELGVEIQNWQPHKAEKEFIDRFDELFDSDTGFVVAKGF